MSMNVVEEDGSRFHLLQCRLHHFFTYKPYIPALHIRHSVNFFG